MLRVRITEDERQTLINPAKASKQTLSERIYCKLAATIATWGHESEICTLPMLHWPCNSSRR